MTNFLKKQWKKLSILLILIILGIGLYIIKSASPTPTPTPTPAVEFKLLKTFPTQGNTEITFPNTSLLFYFSDAVQVDKIEILIDPYITFDFLTTDSDKTVVITPTKFWQLNKTYKIKLTVVSQSGQTLPEILYSFTPTSPKNSDMTN